MVRTLSGYSLKSPSDEVMFDCSRTMDNVDEIWKGSDGVADYKNSDGLLEVVDGKPLL